MNNRIILSLMACPIYLMIMHWTFGNNEKLLLTVNGVILVLLFTGNLILYMKKRKKS